jgi:hypothetical protein
VNLKKDKIWEKERIKYRGKRRKNNKNKEKLKKERVFSFTKGYKNSYSVSRKRW